MPRSDESRGGRSEGVQDVDTGFSYPVMTFKSKPGDDLAKEHEFSGILSTDDVDPQGDKIIAKGIDTRRFMALGGPIIAGSHYSEAFANGECAVVAKALKIQKTPTSLLLKKGVFDTDPLSARYEGKVKRGFMCGLSVGLRVIERDYKDTRRGGTVRIVAKSELIHVLITSQPVNPNAIIAAKSLQRIAELERRVEETLGRSDRLDEIADDIATLQESVKSLVGGEQSPDVPTVDTPESGTDVSPEAIAESLLGLSEVVSGLVDTAFKAAHPELPDDAFIVEKGAERDSDGKVEKKYRHLPHHTASVESPAEHTSINKALLRNALARVNQVKPLKESKSTYIARAEAHLRRHASALGIGEDKE